MLFAAGVDHITLAGASESTSAAIGATLKDGTALSFSAPVALGDDVIACLKQVRVQDDIGGKQTCTHAITSTDSCARVSAALLLAAAAAEPVPHI